MSKRGFISVFILLWTMPLLAQEDFLVVYDNGEERASSDANLEEAAILGGSAAAATYLTYKFITPSWFNKAKAVNDMMKERGVLTGFFGAAYSDMASNHLRSANASSAFGLATLQTFLFVMGREVVENAYVLQIWDRKLLSGGTTESTLADTDLAEFSVLSKQESTNVDADYYLPDARAFIFSQTNGVVDSSICDCYAHKYETGHLYKYCSARLRFIKQTVLRLEDMDRLADRLLYKMETAKAHTAVFNYYVILGKLTRYYVKLSERCTPEHIEYLEALHNRSTNSSGTVTPP